MDAQSNQPIIENKLQNDIHQLSKNDKNILNKKVIFIILLIFTVIFIILGNLLILINSRQAKQAEINKNKLTYSTVSQAISPVPNANNFSYLLKYKNLINDGKIFLMKEGNILILDTTSMKISEFQINDLENLSQLSFSIDGKYLFSNSFTKNHTYIIIYNLLDKQITKIEADTDKIGPNPRVEFGQISPNNKYFIVTTSCCPGDVGRGVFDFQGNLIKQFTGGATLWSPNEEQFVMSKGEFNSFVIPIGEGVWNSSIYLESLKDNTVTEKLLKKATNQTSFIPVEWIDASTFIYKEIIYSKPFPSDPANDEINNEQSWKEWLSIYENPSINYFSLNIKTMRNQRVETYNEKDYKAKIENFSPSKKWKIKYELENNKLLPYIAKSDYTLQIKLDAAHALWMPSLPQEPTNHTTNNP